MPTPPVLKSLIERFQRNLNSYTDPDYNEEQTRTEFISPLFDLDVLGWDVANKHGYAEAYKDVVSEGALKGKSAKASPGFPDYTFRIGGTRKFFVEAKKPSIEIANDGEAAYQLRRYAWSANLPLSILTNFEGLAVYDCRFKPEHTDKASVARINYFTYDQYTERWNEIASTFSRDAVLQGSFDKYAESAEGKRGTTVVDEEFLKEIENWRELLARSIALRNKSLDAFHLNFAVQRTIDRIIFLRMGEDRGIEEYEQLRRIADKDKVYERLLSLFDEADQKYNSGIFHFHKESGRTESEDTLTPSLNIDNQTLSEIISSLYYPKSPYAFSVIGIDILGQVYERFLGKIIRLTETHRAKVEEKPEVRKAGGVYYTPSKIVQYIVENTVGEACGNKSPKEISNLRILDPACGSGSFLIAAYSYLLDFHLKWYVKQGAKKFSGQVYLADDNQYHLTTWEKKRILLDHIFGVDKDSQAVEVTKLNLLLKVLEGEREESLEQQQKLFKERALPDLGKNVAWGNSLIDPSFYQQTNHLGETNQFPIGFDWASEFPTQSKEGGFSVIIGNPPYLKIEELPEAEREYFQKKYPRTYMKRYDAYGLFVDKSIELLRDGGTFGMIIPSTMLNNLTFTKLRKLILEQTNVTRIVNLGGKVFKGVNNDTLILLMKKETQSKQKTQVYDVPKYGGGLTKIQAIGKVDLKANSQPPAYSFELRVTDEADKILTKMKKSSIPLGDICDYFQGLVTGGNEAYIVTSEQISSENLERKACKPVLFGDDVARYKPPKARYQVIYLTKGDDLEEFPKIKKRLEPFKETLAKKREVKLGRQPWYSLHWPRERTNFERERKIIVQCIRNLALKRRVVATLDTQKQYADHTLNVVYLKNQEYELEYVLGILNSKLVNYLFQRKYVDINIKGVYLEEIPIRQIDSGNREEVLKSKKLVELVTEMLDLNNENQLSRTPDEKALVERQLTSLDNQIDEIVYDLYGLDASERETVNASV